MRRLLFASALSAALLGGLPARAAEPGPGAIAGARETFKEAERAFERGEPDKALALFRLAYARAPRDAVRFNIAVCLEQLQRWSEARTEYEAAAASATLADAERTDAQKRANALAPVTAELALSGALDGASVRVDGAPRCAPPCRIFVAPGAHRVDVQRGDIVVTREVQAAAAQTALLPIVFPEPAAAAPPPHPVESPRLAEKSARTGRAGWLTIAGGVVTVAGAAGLVGFGLRADALHDRYLTAPSAAARDEGLLMKGLANGSIGVLAVGALLVVGDLVLFKTGERRKLEASRVGVFSF